MDARLKKTMMPHAHFFFGLAMVFLMMGENSLFSLNVLAFLLGNVLLDLDYVISFLFSSRFRNHRDLITHWPIIYVLGVVLGILLSIDPITWFCAGALGHLMLDTVDWGISWLKPFTEKKFSLLNLQAEVAPDWTFRDFLQHYYSRKFVIVLEVMLIILSMILMLMNMRYLK